METIGTRMRKIRERRHISRRALAQAVGLAPSTIADLENGYQKSTTKLHQIARELGTTPEHLERGGPEKPPHGPQVLTQRELTLVEAFRNASPDGKRAIEGAAVGVSSPLTDSTRNPNRKAI